MLSFVRLRLVRLRVIRGRLLNVCLTCWGLQHVGYWDRGILKVVGVLAMLTAEEN
jgi:hypothetical protein